MYSNILKVMSSLRKYKRVTIDVINDLETRIPINKDGSFDTKKQQELAMKFQAIEETKNKVEKRKEEFNNNFKDILGL